MRKRKSTRLNAPGTRRNAALSGVVCFAAGRASRLRPMHVSGARARRIELCGVRVDVQTDCAHFDRYLAAHFPSSREAEGATDLRVSVRWFEETETPRAALFAGAPTDVQL